MKIEPKHLGIGMYQVSVAEGKLTKSFLGMERLATLMGKTINDNY